MWLFRSFDQLCFDHWISCTCDIFDQLCLVYHQLCVSFNQLQMWLFWSVVLDIWSFECSFSISCSSNIFDQLCMVKILSCGWFSIDWMFYIWAVVMCVIFSISCDVLHCFWQKWSIFCQGLEFCKRTPGGCFWLYVGVTMELRQNIPGMFIEEKNTNLRRCLRAAFVWYFCKRCFCAERFFKIYPKCREKSVQSVSLFCWETFLHDNSNLV